MQQLRRLSGRRAARLEAGAFVVEGPTLVREAMRAGVVVRELFVAPGADPQLAAAAQDDGIVVHSVTADVLARSIDTVTPQGMAAIAGRVEVSIDDALAAAARGPLTIVLVDVGDPGNAGTLLRAAEAAGASAVLFCGASVDPSNPKCVRASAGALFHLPVAMGGEVRPVLEALRRAGVPTAATVVRDGAPYDSVDLTGPVALLLGSEPHGLPDDVVALVDHRLTIPMVGRSESLNVAMAGAVLCFESLRQRRGAGL
ncbi:MAG: RNA methyltransferase [Acidimicrobiales bacterium]